MKFNIYHHNDFDGISSAAIFSKYLKNFEGIKLDEIDFYAVDYNLKSEWPDMTIKRPSAVLDFLYHNEADWWFDHHIDPFLTKCAIKKPYKRSEKQYWNTKFLSCPSLIVSHFYKFNRSISIRLKKEYEKLLKWSDIIDGAKYDAPSDLYGFNNIFMNINKTLALCQTNEYIYEIIKTIYHNDFDSLNNNSNYKKLIEESKNKEDIAIKKVTEIIEVDKKVAFFDQSSFDFPFQRYLAYYLYPSIYYRVAIFKKEDKYSVSVNYNNWIDKKNKVNIGRICNKFGGGGRYNVGGVLTDKHDDALKIANYIRELLQKSTSTQLELFEYNNKKSNIKLNADG